MPADGTISQTGSFTPAAVPADAELNPYVDAGPWGVVVIGPVLVPGVVEAVDGCDKPDEWSVQKGTASSDATTVWKGTKLAESLKIRTRLPNAQSIVDYYVLRDTLRPKAGVKPPSFLIINPIINFSGLVAVSHKNVAPPKWSQSGGYWVGEIELVEYSPSKPANTGPASSAWSGGAHNAPDPNADVKAELQAAMNAAAKA